MRRSQYIGTLENSLYNNDVFIFYELLLNDPDLGDESASARAFRSLGKYVRSYFDSIHINESKDIYAKGSELVALGWEERRKEIAMLKQEYGLDDAMAEHLLSNKNYYRYNYVQLFNELTDNIQLAQDMKEKVELMLQMRQAAKSSKQENWRKIGLSESSFFGGNFLARFNDILNKKINEPVFAQTIAQWVQNDTIDKTRVESYIRELVDETIDFLFNPKAIQQSSQYTQEELQMAQILQQLNTDSQALMTFKSNVQDIVKNIFGLDRFYSALQKEIREQKKIGNTPQLESEQVKSIMQQKIQIKNGVNFFKRGYLEEASRNAFNTVARKHKNIKGAEFRTEVSQAMTDMVQVLGTKINDPSNKVSIKIPDLSSFTSEIKVNSSRQQFGQALQTWYNQVQKLPKKSAHPYVIFSSVKSSNLTGNFKGFGGTKFNYQNTLNLLHQLNGNAQSKAESFLKKMLNTMNGAILQNRKAETLNEFRLAMSTHIAQFLFDDYEMLGKSNNNAIHIFQLNNINVPLSSFLIGAGKAIQKTNEINNNFFNIRVSLESGIDFPREKRIFSIRSNVNNSEHTEAKRLTPVFYYDNYEKGAVPGNESNEYAWNHQAIQAMKSFSLSIQFYKNFIQEIVEAIEE